MKAGNTATAGAEYAQPHRVARKSRAQPGPAHRARQCGDGLGNLGRAVTARNCRGPAWRSRDVGEQSGTRLLIFVIL